MHPSPDKMDLTRRQFMTRAAKAGVSIAAAGAAGLWFHDSRGPGRPQMIESDIRPGEVKDRSGKLVFRCVPTPPTHGPDAALRTPLALRRMLAYKRL